MTQTYFQIKDGQLVNKYTIKKAFDLSDGKYELVIKRKNKRSLPINKYYWGCVVELEREGFKSRGYDYSKEQVHDFNKAEFNYTELVNEETGEVKKVPSTTTDISNTQFIEFLERIKLFCAEWLNVYVPDPNEQTQFSYE
jgi:hypothetical protein